MPQSNQSEDPATSVTVLAIQPPVQLSAVTKWSWPARRRVPSDSARTRSSASVGVDMDDPVRGRGIVDGKRPRVCVHTRQVHLRVPIKSEAGRTRLHREPYDTAQ